jgi:hypothetical protein
MRLTLLQRLLILSIIHQNSQPRTLLHTLYTYQVGICLDGRANSIEGISVKAACTVMTNRQFRRVDCKNKM